jgi:hypothetical protein
VEDIAGMAAVTSDTENATLSERTPLPRYFDVMVPERKRGAVPVITSGFSSSVLADCVGAKAQTTSDSGYRSW